MSTSYAGVNVFPTTIPIPSDGDMKTAASVGAALQGLKDATIYLAGISTGVNPGGTYNSPTLRGNVTIQNHALLRALSISNMAITVSDTSDITIAGTIGTSSTISITRHVNLPAGNWTFGGASSQTVSFSCPTFFNQPMSPAGQGRLRKRRQLASAGSGLVRTISAGSTDVYIIRAGDIASGTQGNIQNGTADGSNSCFDEIQIVSSEVTHGFALFGQDGVTALTDTNGAPLVVKGNPSGSGQYRSVRLLWTGSYWEMIGQ